ncbi:MAG: helix-turn-helix domain-containing protein, partial [Shinella sp.]
SEREVPVDLRFVFATNAELEKEVQAGRFRADLFFRINVMQIHLPPLKEREGDSLELATLFMKKLSAQLAMPAVPIDAAARRALSAYDWPGNVRELRNLIERTLILGRFPEGFGPGVSAPASAEAGSLADVERRHILAVLAACTGQRDEAARQLGISRKTIDRKLAAWDG